MSGFLLHRCLGLAYIVDGLCIFFTGRSPVSSLSVARHMARSRLKAYGSNEQKDQQ
jgi:hypothetical protein